MQTFVQVLKNVSLQALTLKERSHSNLEYTLKIVLKNNQQDADMEAENGWENYYQAKGVQNTN